MLDLDARIHLDEIEFAVVVEKLDCAGALVIHLAHGIGANLADFETLCEIERGRGAFLEHLLMAALQRAIALAKVDRMALTVAKHLHFDMARIVEKFFKIDGIVAEGRLGLAARHAERRGEFVSRTRDFHAAAAASGRRLDDDRIADLLGDPQRFVGVNRPVRARHAGNTEFLCGALGLDLVAHQPDVLSARANEFDLVLGENFGESRIFGKKAIARMHCPLLRSFPPFRSLSSGARLNSTMVSINGPTRIGHATVMPGDVVLGRNGGVLFIPPQLAERVVKESESTRLRDTFGHQRLREKKYTAGQIDARWSPEIEADYRGWLKENEDHLTVPKAQIEEILKEEKPSN